MIEIKKNLSAGAAAHMSYAESGASHSHKYLLPDVRSFLGSMGATGRILDLGCGNGSMLKSVIRPGWEVYGIDASPSGIGMAARLIPGGSFYLADGAGELPAQLDLASFDAVISTETVEHVLRPRVLARNAFDLLKPGGSLLVSTPYHGYVKNLALAATNKMDAHFTALWDGGHIKFWSRRTLTSLLEEAGFERVSFHGVGRIPWIWKSMVITCVKPQAPR